MPRTCQKCGAEIPEGSPVCRSCFEPVPAEGLLKRLFRFLSGGRVSLMKMSSLPGARVNVRVSESIKIRDPFTGQLREYHSLDEVPEEFREQIRKARAAMVKGSGSSQNSITVTDAAGKTQTYHSLQELPPDIRALYEKVRKGESPGSQ